jgi:hypothetical protein
MFWLVADILGFIGTPIGLFYGWVTYCKQNAERGIRTRMSLLGLVAASLSIALLVLSFVAPAAGWKTTDPPVRILVRSGVIAAVAAMALSLAGRARLILPVWLASIGAVMLWYGLTLR